MSTVLSENIPTKLRDDAIVEALCSVQFQASEPLEVIIGRLTDVHLWSEFQIIRLPVADIPAPLRQADSTWKFQPSFQLRNKDGNRLIHVGENTFSYHVVGVKNYCGWQIFLSELKAAFAALFEKLKKPEIRRIGFRYINAIVPQRHFIESTHDLNLDIRVGSEKLSGPVNLNYTTVNDSNHVTTTRIAHKSFVQGNLPPDAEVVVDVEVNTPQNYTVSSLDAFVDWVSAAHDFEKAAFFRLIPQSVVNQLKED